MFGLGGRVSQQELQHSASSFPSSFVGILFACNQQMLVVVEGMWVFTLPNQGVCYDLVSYFSVPFFHLQFSLVDGT